MVRLGDLIEQIRGVSYKPEDVYDELNGNSVALLRANNIKDGQLNFDDVIYVDKKRVRDNQLLKAGDILICTSSGSKELVGKAAYIQEDLLMTFGAFCKVVRPQKIRSDYLGHFFNSPNYRQKISDASTGANINNIRNEHIDGLEILLPTVDRQEYIAVVLNKLSNLISLRKQQLAKLDELVKVRFVEMFGDLTENPKQWEKESLGNHVDILTGFPFDSTGYVSSGIKICGGLIIMPGKINWEDCKWWPNVIGYEDYLLADTDIVMALDRPWISDGFKIAMISKYDLPCLLIQRTARIRSKDMNQWFIYYLLKDEAFSTHCNVTGSLVPHISHKDFKSYPVIVPPVALQDEFAFFTKKAEGQKLTIQQSLDKLEVLKKSLMQEYFG